MVGIFVVEVHLNVVHAIKFTILHFLRHTSFKDALYHFRKIVKIAKKKIFFTFRHFEIQIHFQIPKYRRIQIQDYVARVLLYIHSITSFKPEFGS